jgi:Zn-dependent peptidase ImmA (M78 family)/DNA-binding XRE family transcriptional regulator
VKTSDSDAVVQARISRALFDRIRLRLAREYNGFRKVDLAKLLDLTPSAITQFENGTAKPSPAKLIELSMALGFEPAFFARDGARKDGEQLTASFGRAFFRSLRSTRQIERDRADTQALFVSEIVSAITKQVRLPSVNIPSSLHLPENATAEMIEHAADELRKFWNVQPGPVANVARLLEANGVIVTRCFLGCDDVSAFSRWFDRRPIVVLSAAKDDLPRLRFDACHELGHLTLHPVPEPGNGILEAQAQAFASAFLMPQDQIRAQLPRSLDMERYGQLKHTWGVSIQALLYRAHVLQRMSDATYRRAMMTFNRNDWRRREPFPLIGHEEITLLPRAFDLLQQTSAYSIRSLAIETRLPLAFVSEIVGRPANDERPSLTIQA